MPVPEVYLAHARSIAKHIVNGETKADVVAITEKLKKSYDEPLARRIAECAIKLANEDTSNNSS